MKSSTYLNSFSPQTRKSNLSIPQDAPIIQIIEISRIIASYRSLGSLGVAEAWASQLKELFYFGPEFPQMYALSLEEMMTYLGKNRSSSHHSSSSSDQSKGEGEGKGEGEEEEGKPFLLNRLTDHPNEPSKFRSRSPPLICPLDQQSVTSSSVTANQSILEKKVKKIFQGRRSIPNTESTPTAPALKEWSVSLTSLPPPPYQEGERVLTWGSRWREWT